MRKQKILVLATLAAVISPLVLSSSASAQGEPKSNQFWWPDNLSFAPLRQNSAESDPMGTGFSYAEAFNGLDLEAVKQDIEALMTTSQDWCP